MISELLYILNQVPKPNFVAIGDLVPAPSDKKGFSNQRKKRKLQRQTRCSSYKKK